LFHNTHKKQAEAQTVGPVMIEPTTEGL
jgi:hypothetical protein